MKANEKIDKHFLTGNTATRAGYKRIAGGDLKKRSRYANCGQRGRWAESCRNPYTSKQDRLAEEKKKQESNPSGTYFFVHED